jgi:hypothetical protein
MLSLPKTPSLVKPIRYQKPLGGATGCPDPSWVREEGRPGKQVVKSCLPTTTVIRKSGGVDYTRVQFFLG